MDNTRVVDPHQSGSGKWRVCTGNQARNFSSEKDAECAAQLCSVAHEAGRQDKAKEVRDVLNVR